MHCSQTIYSTSYYGKSLPYIVFRRSQQLSAPRRRSRHLNGKVDPPSGLDCSFLFREAIILGRQVPARPLWPFRGNGPEHSILCSSHGPLEPLMVLMLPEMDNESTLTGGFSYSSGVLQSFFASFGGVGRKSWGAFRFHSRVGLRNIMICTIFRTEHRGGIRAYNSSTHSYGALRTTTGNNATLNSLWYPCQVFFFQSR